jgi:purine nucleosidase
MTRRGLRRIGIAAILLIVLLMLSPALPIPAWRSGRVDAPPLALSELRQPAADRVWIDTDAACDVSASTDPDDCLAIAWLARRGVEIVGISTSFGNTDSARVEATARALVARIEAAGLPEPPIHRGAFGPLDATGDDAAPAIAALRAAIAEAPLTILALGPLTNIAAALADRPELERNVTQLVAVMGHRPGHLFHPTEGSGGGAWFGHGPIFRDLNFAKDPDAARAVLRMKAPLVLVPYDAARAVRIDAAALDAIAAGGPAQAWAVERSRAWLEHWREAMGLPGFYPFDWIAAALTLEPAEFRCARATAWVAREWAWWVMPRAALLVGPEAPRGAGIAASVLYCPEVAETLRERMLADGG